MTLRDWLKRPIAHRGLHAREKGVIENTASAFAAAIAGDYGVECDLQEAACGEPMVFHDNRLERLTLGVGRVREHSAAALKAIPFRESSDRMQTLGELLDQVDSRTPLFLEVKGDKTQAPRYCARIASILSEYRGPAAVMAFDPAIVTAFRTLAPGTPRGLVSCRHRPANWPALTPWERVARTHLLSAPVARPHFIAYNLQSLPALAPWILRRVLGRPLIVWTVKSQAEAAHAKALADSIIFEGFLA